MTWHWWLAIVWLCGLTGVCLFFYGAFKNQRRNFCADCGGWWEFCNCLAVECPRCKGIDIGVMGGVGDGYCCLNPECLHTFIPVEEITKRIDKALEDIFREVDEHADNNPRH